MAVSHLFSNDFEIDIYSEVRTCELDPIAPQRRFEQAAVATSKCAILFQRGQCRNTNDGKESLPMACWCAPGSVPLMKAAAQGQVQIVQDQLQEDPTFVLHKGGGGLRDTAWHLAAANGHSQVLQALYESLETNISLLRETLASSGKLPGATCLDDESIKRFVVNKLNIKGQTPLMFACFACKAECVTLLMKMGADPWIVDRCGQRSALHYAALKGNVDCITAIMAALTAQNHLTITSYGNILRLIDIRTLGGYTPLHYAAYCRLPGVCRVLMEWNANHVSTTTRDSEYDVLSCCPGSTPLHVAALTGNEAAVNEILQFYRSRRETGTLRDPRVCKDSLGRLPFHNALRRNHALVAELLHPLSPLEVLYAPDQFESVGAAKLAVIAANALKQSLLSMVDSADDLISKLPPVSIQGSSLAGRSSCFAARHSNVHHNMTDVKGMSPSKTRGYTEIMTAMLSVRSGPRATSGSTHGAAGRTWCETPPSAFAIPPVALGVPPTMLGHTGNVAKDHFESPFVQCFVPSQGVSACPGSCKTHADADAVMHVAVGTNVAGLDVQEAIAETASKLTAAASPSTHLHCSLDGRVALPASDNTCAYNVKGHSHLQQRHTGNVGPVAAPRRSLDSQKYMAAKATACGRSRHAPMLTQLQENHVVVPASSIPYQALNIKADARRSLQNDRNCDCRCEGVTAACDRNVRDSVNDQGQDASTTQLDSNTDMSAVESDGRRIGVKLSSSLLASGSCSRDNQSSTELRAEHDLLAEGKDIVFVTDMQQVQQHGKVQACDFPPPSGPCQHAGAPEQPTQIEASPFYTNAMFSAPACAVSGGEVLLQQTTSAAPQLTRLQEFEALFGGSQHSLHCGSLLPGGHSDSQIHWMQQHQQYDANAYKNRAFMDEPGVGKALSFKQPPPGHMMGEPSPIDSTTVLVSQNTLSKVLKSLKSVASKRGRRKASKAPYASGAHVDLHSILGYSNYTATTYSVLGSGAFSQYAATGYGGYLNGPSRAGNTAESPWRGQDETFASVAVPAVPGLDQTYSQAETIDQVLIGNPHPFVEVPSMNTTPLAESTVLQHAQHGVATSDAHGNAARSSRAQGGPNPFATISWGTHNMVMSMPMLSQCLICLDEVYAVVLSPCLHRLCVPCARRCIMALQDKPLACPVCRQMVRGCHAPNDMQALQMIVSRP